MSTQIFKTKISNEILFNLLNSICVKNDKYYLLNNDSFKRGMLNEDIHSFIDECKPCYHISKQKYLDKKMNYKSFITIIRQICNFNKIKYTSQIKYEKSSYNIIYYIYHSF